MLRRQCHRVGAARPSRLGGTTATPPHVGGNAAMPVARLNNVEGAFGRQALTERFALAVRTMLPHVGQRLIANVQGN
jgi:hypothetical protein